MRKDVKLGDVAKIYSGGTPSRTKPSYWGGNIPWIKTTQIQNCVITEKDVDEWITTEGMKNSSAKMVPRGTILMAMYGQGKTRGQVAVLGIDATINQACAAIIVKDDADNNYIYQQLLYRYSSIRNLSNTGSQENLNSALIKSIAFPLPELILQKKIAVLLSTWDQAIETTEGLIAAKERKLKGLIKKLIINNPEKKKWGKYPLGNFVIERKEKSSVHNQYPTITSSRRGIFLQEEYFSKQVTSRDNSSYKIIKKGDFTFRSMSDDGIFVFNRLLQIDIGIISPAYGVFYANGVDPDYLYYFLNSSDFKRALVGESQGGTRTALKLSAIKRINVGLPIYNIQKTIAAILNITQQEIDLLKKQLDAYRKQKRGLMQKLLTGQWRVKINKEETN